MGGAKCASSALYRTRGDLRGALPRFDLACAKTPHPPAGCRPRPRCAQILLTLLVMARPRRADAKPVVLILRSASQQRAKRPTVLALQRQAMANQATSLKRAQVGHKGGLRHSPED